MVFFNFEDKHRDFRNRHRLSREKALKDILHFVAQSLMGGISESVDRSCSAAQPVITEQQQSSKSGQVERHFLRLRPKPE